MRKYGESKTTRIMMETVPHVTSGLGIRKFQADGFLLARVYLIRQTYHDVWEFRTVHVFRLSGARWTTLDALAWIMKGPKVDCCERSNEPTATCRKCIIYWMAELHLASAVDSCLEGTKGWMKLHNEELIWKEQEVGENYIKRRFVRCMFRQILL